MPAFRPHLTHFCSQGQTPGIGLYNGKGDTNLILVLQLKYYNLGEKNPYSFAKVLTAGNYSIPVQYYVSGIYSI